MADSAALFRQLFFSAGSFHKSPLPEYKSDTIVLPKNQLIRAGLEKLKFSRSNAYCRQPKPAIDIPQPVKKTKWHNVPPAPLIPHAFRAQ